ncbi:hypothetical protein JHW33_08355 [Rahnella aceris]|uniref:hypothetical protein n=1 Tax=Rahnella sp. (strain Y9602) TaxID=2703885 RepID=UPI001905A6DC|nr:hypothetical protein [Rahnella aceris]QQN36607.1 hypothetical protein JHW33_08355 [Rahnella aceris]
MRYYKLEIVDKTGKTPLDSAGNPIGPFDTSKSPGAGLQLQFDALITGYDVISSGTALALYGVPITMLRESTQLAGCMAYLTAGFTDGLPLENSHQHGLIISGEIYNPYANWQGTHQSLNLIVNPSPLLNDRGQAASITLNGKTGDQLSDVLRSGLSTAFPGFIIDITISDKLVWTENAPAVYTRLSQLATTVRSHSFYTMNQDDYTGVQMVIQGQTLRIFDNTSVQSGGIQILPQELIGQPTWIGPFSVSFKCPMRAELHCGDIVQLPENITSGPGALLAISNERTLSSFRNQVNFSGNFLITSVRYVGDYLNPDSSNAWVTIFEAIALGKQSA